MEICRGINATDQVNTIVATGIWNTLIQGFQNFGGHWPAIWVKVEPPTGGNPDCTWEGYSQTDNCNYLIEAVTAISTNGGTGGQIAGVFSTPYLWNKYFGTSCDMIGTTKYGHGATGTTHTYLWYARYNTSGQVDPTPSFDDYIPFGGWEVSAANLKQKQVGGNVTLTNFCNTPGWNIEIDSVWGPSW